MNKPADHHGAGSQCSENRSRSTGTVRQNLARSTLVQVMFRFGNSWCRPVFRASETILLLLLPVFIACSYQPYLNTDTWFLIALAFVICWLLDKMYFCRKRKWSERMLMCLCLGSVLIFMSGLWQIYSVHALRLFPDTYDYIRQGREHIWSGAFWFWGERTFVTPLLFRLVGFKWTLLNKVYIVMYLSSSLLFVLSMSGFFQRFRVKLLTCYVLLMLFSNQHSVNLWLSCALSETPAIVLTLLVFSFLAIIYASRQQINARTGMDSILVVFMAVLLFLYTFVRDTNVYFLPCILLFSLLVFHKMSARILIVALVLSIMGGHYYALKKSERWKYPLANVIMWRILPHTEWRHVFQQKYQLPPDELVMGCAEKWAYETCPNKELLVTCRSCNNDRPDARDWISSYGLWAYQHFLITHPGYVFEVLLNHWDLYNADLWWYAPHRIQKRKLNEFMFDFPGKITKIHALLIVLFGLVFFKKNPLILLLIAHTGIIGLASVHGDVMEFTRHCQQAALTLKIAYVLTILQVYTRSITLFNAKTVLENAYGTYPSEDHKKY
ncbi:hypothetical protein JXQ70_07950 [bacterium]|nr:hypothetical protein [bacterium]